MVAADRVARNPPPQLLLVLIMCLLVRVSLVFRRTQCFAENVWVKAANVSKSSHLRHLNLLFLVEVLPVATEGGLCYLKRSNLRNAPLRHNPVIDSLLAGAGPPWLRLGRRPLLPGELRTANETAAQSLCVVHSRVQQGSEQNTIELAWAWVVTEVLLFGCVLCALILETAEVKPRKLPK